jgi:hypothetical protein
LSRFYFLYFQFFFPIFVFVFSLQLAPLQPAPAVLNFNEAAIDQTNGIYGELAVLIDGVVNDGNEPAWLSSTMSSNNNRAQPSLSEPGGQHYVELNDIIFGQEEEFLPNFYDPVPSPEMDIDTFFL